MSTSEEEQHEVRSFIMPRDPSIDGLSRPKPKQRAALFSNIEEENYSGYSSSIYSDVDDEISETTSVTSGNCAATSDSGIMGASVYLRLRPVEYPSITYTVSEDSNVLITKAPVTSNVTKNHKEKHYSFTSIFDGNISQKEVYEMCIDQYIKAEESFTIMTYGTSGSGKTFTLLGDISNPGIIPRFMEAIFTFHKDNLSEQPTIKLINGQVTILSEHDTTSENLLRNNVLSCCTNLINEYENLQRSVQLEHEFMNRHPSDDAVVFTWISFVEIYNENVYDLLTVKESEFPRSKKHLSLKQPTRKVLKIINNNGRGFISGVTSIYVKNSLEALMLLRYGQQKITYASTTINENSSRSHCIFILDVLTFYPSGRVEPKSYTFCDLAGTERQYKTGNVGCRFKETRCINTSLMVLGRCLEAATQKGERLPLRESKLTMLLQSPLQGKEKLTIIVNIMPTNDYYEENLHILNFASIAQSIIFKTNNHRHHSRYSALLDEKHNWKQICMRQQKQLNELEEELKHWPIRHKQELDALEVNLRKEIVDTFEKIIAENKSSYEKFTEKRLNSQRSFYEVQIDLLKKRNAALKAELDELLAEEKEVMENTLGLESNESSSNNNEC